jgi:hypothetical protein
MFILPNSWADKIYDQVTFMYQNLENPSWYGTANKGFFHWEADKFKRIYELLKTKEETLAVSRQQRDFVKFVDEHDRRRGTDFLATFPELGELYTTWKNN